MVWEGQIYLKSLHGQGETFRMDPAVSGSHCESPIVENDPKRFLHL